MNSLTLQEQLSSIKTEMFKENEIRIEIKHIDNKIDSKIDGNLHSTTLKESTMNKINYNGSLENDIDLKDIKRGDVVWINLFGSVGSEQSSDKYGRPCVCIQNNIGNTHSPTIIVACVTSQLTKSRIPTHIEITTPERYGLSKDSIVLLEQIRTVDKKKRILKRTGHLDELLMKQIDKGLLVSVFDLQEKTPLERLPKYIRKKIEEKLDDIITYEKAIYKTNDKNLIQNLSEQKEAFLWSLQKFCEDNNLNYRDYYKEYNPEKESIAM